MSPAHDDLHRLGLRVQLAAFPETVLGVDALRLVEGGLGGTCLFGSNTRGGAQHVRTLVQQVHEAHEAALVAVDEEGGDVTRLHAETGSPLPGPAVLGAVDDPEATAATARALGAELAALGIDLDLAPVADVNSNADNPIIGVRSFGADPEHAARHVAAWVTGLQAAGVAACAKHFPGHGDTGRDSHTELPVLDVPLELLRRRELLPFAAAVAAGTASVMTSHILLPALDDQLPATLSPRVLGLLRDELGFGGAILTDALDMAGASGGGRGIPRAAVLALVAGADLLCLGPDKDAGLVEAVRDAVVDAVRCGELPEQRLRDAAARVDALRRPAPQQDSAPPPDAVDLARRALSVSGALSPLAGALVVRVDTPPTIAVGDVPWGLAADLVLDPGDGGALTELLRRAAGSPVVLQVRDAHRWPQAGALVRAVAQQLPGSVVVEYGWATPLDLPVPRVCTSGASTASRDAVAALLRESAGWDR
jgi:beta-N-acetylhexosaminidase